MSNQSKCLLFFTDILAIHQDLLENFQPMLIYISASTARLLGCFCMSEDDKENKPMMDSDNVENDAKVNRKGEKCRYFNF